MPSALIVPSPNWMIVCVAHSSPALLPSQMMANANAPAAIRAV